VIAGASLAATTLAACGPGEDESGSAATVELMVAGYSDTTKALWEGIIKDFEAENPDVNIELSVQSWTDITDVVTTRVQSQEAPDLLNIDAYATYASEGLLYPAEEVASPELLADFQPSFVENASIDGTQWGLPFIASARAMFYNKDIFSKAGVPAPPTTWAELEAAAQKIKESGEIAYGMPLGALEAQGESALWFYGAGGGYGDASTITIDTPENLEGAQQMQKLLEAGLTQPDAGATDRDPLLNVFTQGKIGMMVGLPQTVVQIQQKNPDLNYGIAPIATQDGSAFTLGVADHMMAFKKDVDKREAITKFLDYFYSAEVYSKWVSTEGFLPVTQSGAEALESNEDLKPFVEALPDAEFYPATNPKWPIAQSTLQQQMGQLAQGADPAELLEQIQAKIGQ
jgi:multiple sugar transport system substrate-binding protein